jgi:hypothetical protein
LLDQNIKSTGIGVDESLDAINRVPTLLDQNIKSAGIGVDESPDAINRVPTVFAGLR